MWAGSFASLLILSFITTSFFAIPVSAQFGVPEQDAPPQSQADCQAGTTFQPGVSTPTLTTPNRCVSDGPPESQADCGPDEEFRPGGGTGLGGVPAQCVNPTEDPQNAEDCTEEGTYFREPGTAGPTDPGGCAPIPAGCSGSTLEGEADPTIECPNDGTEDVKCSASSSLSWLLCPLLYMGIEGSEIAAGIIETLLYVDPLTTSNRAGNTSVVYQVWSNIRNFANVLFIFVMFALIYSQATSMGISAYGVKRMLPKLIAAAILANLSFFLCAIAVDIFNVIGAGMRDLLSSALQVQIGSQDAYLGENDQGAGDTILNFVGILGAGIAGIALAGALVIFLASSWALVLLFLVVAILTLAARQGLIVLLVLLAPIAFAAWVLPNTEQYFKKWFELFFSLLLMYPLVMALFAGAKVAAFVLAGSDRGSDFDQNVLTTLAVLVAVSPFVLLPALFKVGNYSLGKIGQMARGSAVGKRADEAGKNSVLGQKRQERKNARQIAARQRYYRNGGNDRRNAAGLYGRLTSTWDAGKKRAVQGATGGRYGEYLDETSRLADQRLDEARESLEKENAGIHSSNLNRDGATMASAGLKSFDGKVIVNASGDTIVDADGNVQNTAEAQRIKDQFGVDVGTARGNAQSMGSLQYATENGLMDKNNFGGARALADSLHSYGNMTEAAARSIVGTGRSTNDKAKINEILNGEAQKAGQSYLGYNSVDQSGNFVPGGARAELGPGREKEAVVKHVIDSKGLGGITKEMAGDSAWKVEVGTQVADYMTTSDPARRESFERQAAAMNDKVVDKLAPEVAAAAGITRDQAAQQLRQARVSGATKYRT